jgi:hypothetical protein
MVRPISLWTQGAGLIDPINICALPRLHPLQFVEQDQNQLPPGALSQ